MERLKRQKSTSSDIYYPLWEHGKLHILPTGERVAVFPAYREKAVRYFDIGFVRRFVVRLSAQSVVQDARLLEMAGNKAYLTQHKDRIAEEYFRGTLQNTPVYIFEKPVNLDPNKSTCIDPVGNAFCNGIFAFVFGDGGVYVGATSGWSFFDLGGLGSIPPGTDWGGYGESYNFGWYANYDDYYYDYGGGGGNGGSYNPANNPNGYVFEYPPMDWGGINIGSGSGFDFGDNTFNWGITFPFPPQLPPAYLHDAFKSFLFPNSYATAEGWEKMNKEFTKVHDSSCLMQLLIKDLSATGKPVQIVAYTNISAVANIGVVLGKTKLGEGMNQTGQNVPIIHITLSNALFTNATWKTSIANTLFEELIHGVQLVHESQAVLNAPVATSNREFEAKVLQDIVYILSGEKTFQVFPMAFDGKKNQEYEDWLDEITNKGKEMPDFSTPLAQNKYSEKLDAFIAHWSAKGNAIYGAPKSYHQPTFLFELLEKAKNQNCKK